LDGGAKAFFVGLLFVDEDRTVPYKEDKIYKKFSIEQYDRVIENECSKSGATYISLRDVPKDRQYLFDGLHPSQKGHEEIAKRVLNALAPHFS
jgi:lysophospholipase L1-like esterase